MTGPDSCIGFMVVRRQRAGTLTENALGEFDNAAIFPTEDDAEWDREHLNMPKDWEVVRVEIRLAPSPQTVKETP